MDRIDHYYAVQHRDSEAFLEVIPVRISDREPSRTFRTGTPVCVRRRDTRPIATQASDDAAMWHYDQHGKIISKGGARDFLVLTAVFVERRAPLSAGLKRVGTWEVMLCNQEGTAIITAHQQWSISADGTIRLRADPSVCLAVSAQSHEDDSISILTAAPYSEAKHARLTWHLGWYVEPEVPLLDRFVGCMLGLATGDALGAPFEGWYARPPQVPHCQGGGIRLPA